MYRLFGDTKWSKWRTALLSKRNNPADVQNVTGYFINNIFFVELKHVLMKKYLLFSLRTLTCWIWGALKSNEKRCWRSYRGTCGSYMEPSDNRKQKTERLIRLNIKRCVTFNECRIDESQNCGVYMDPKDNNFALKNVHTKPVKPVKSNVKTCLIQPVQEDISAYMSGWVTWPGGYCKNCLVHIGPNTEKQIFCKINKYVNTGIRSIKISQIKCK